MKGQDCYDACTCPWNRRQRRRHLDWGGFEILNVDVMMGTQFDLHGIGTWGYLCHLARRGLVVAVQAAHPAAQCLG